MNIKLISDLTLRFRGYRRIQEGQDEALDPDQQKKCLQFTKKEKKAILRIIRDHLTQEEFFFNPTGTATCEITYIENLDSLVANYNSNLSEIDKKCSELVEPRIPKKLGISRNKFCLRLLINNKDIGLAKQYFMDR